MDKWTKITDQKPEYNKPVFLYDGRIDKHYFAELQQKTELFNGDSWKMSKILTKPVEKTDQWIYNNLPKPIPLDN